jgi:hypothetical protein
MIKEQILAPSDPCKGMWYVWPDRWLRREPPPHTGVTRIVVFYFGVAL